MDDVSTGWKLFGWVVMAIVTGLVGSGGALKLGNWMLDALRQRWERQRQEKEGKRKDAAEDRAWLLGEKDRFIEVQEKKLQALETELRLANERWEGRLREVEAKLEREREEHEAERRDFERKKQALYRVHTRLFTRVESLEDTVERLRSDGSETSDDGWVAAYIVSDQFGNILDWNPGATRLFGWSARETIGKRAAMLVPPEFRDAYIMGMQRVVTSGVAPDTARVYQLQALTKSGERQDINGRLFAWSRAGKWTFGMRAWERFAEVPDNGDPQEPRIGTTGGKNSTSDTLSKGQADEIVAEVGEVPHERTSETSAAG